MIIFSILISSGKRARVNTVVFPYGNDDQGPVDDKISNGHLPDTPTTSPHSGHTNCHDTGPSHETGHDIGQSHENL